MMKNVQEKGVSPVIGVILMVAITVIIAAVVGQFVLGLGDQLNEDADAAVNFDQQYNFTSQSYSVTMTVTQMTNADYLAVDVIGSPENAEHEVVIDEDINSQDDIHIDWTDATNANTTSSGELPGTFAPGAHAAETGDSVTVHCLSGESTVQVRAGLSGQETVISTFDIEDVQNTGDSVNASQCEER